MTDYAAFVFYVNRPDLLCRSLNSFRDLWPELTIIDNSENGVEEDMREKHLDMIAFVSSRVYRPPVPLSYSQSFNLMWKMAASKSFILHFHSDAHSTNPNAVQELLEYARRDKADGIRRACWWTFYDTLWAINVEALADIGGCDTNFFSYFIDQDLKRRWHLAGWETHDTNIQGLSHVGSATINSDPKLKATIGRVFPLQSHLYELKWGGPPGSERYRQPYNEAFMDLKP